jgi:integrase
LVIAHPTGRPIEGSQIDKRFYELITLHRFPKVEFHSLRHLSTTVKLQICNGDIKAVQGDTGHTQAKMVTDTYAHIVDQNRRKTAQKFEEQFYGNPSSTNAALEQFLAYCASNPNALAEIQKMMTAANVDGH